MTAAMRAARVAPSPRSHLSIRRHRYETERLASVRSYEVLDTPPDDAFDALTRLASTVLAVPVSLLSLIDDDRQWVLSRYGTDVLEVPRDESVCSDVVAAAAPVVVRDLRTSPRYAGLSWVRGGWRPRGYAAAPLIGRDGLPLGSLCVMDSEPRDFTIAELRALDDLARQAVTVLELRRSDTASGLRSALLVPELRDPTTVRRALENGEFFPHFQPVVDLDTGAVTALEALMRWRHPTRGILSPEAFLPALETGNLIRWSGRAVLEATCSLINDLRATGLTLAEGVAVNVSSRQLTNSRLARRVLDVLAAHEVPGTAITVEITESVEIIDVDNARAELSKLRDAGVRVVADDFGVGWSNLVRLLQLPMSGLKIDRELVGGMIGDPVRDQMVASAIALGATMGLDVVAEGVETREVSDRLRELGCQRGQGWLFSRAVPAGAVPALISGARGGGPVVGRPVRGTALVGGPPVDPVR